MLKCCYCNKENNKRLVATVHKMERGKLLITVQAKESNVRTTDNQFDFYLRRGEEFKFCSVKCLVKYMGYFSK